MGRRLERELVAHKSAATRPGRLHLQEPECHALFGLEYVPPHRLGEGRRVRRAGSGLRDVWSSYNHVSDELSEKSHDQGDGTRQDSLLNDMAGQQERVVQGGQAWLQGMRHGKAAARSSRASCTATTAFND